MLWNSVPSVFHLGMLWNSVPSVFHLGMLWDSVPSVFHLGMLWNSVFKDWYSHCTLCHLQEGALACLHGHFVTRLTTCGTILGHFGDTPQLFYTHSVRPTLPAVFQVFTAIAHYLMVFFWASMSCGSGVFRRSTALHLSTCIPQR
jgi:hypothetical protein